MLPSLTMHPVIPSLTPTAIPMTAIHVNAPVPSSSPASANSFAERITLLIQRVGSATEIARMCGFSEGVVRSWRDGNSDPSRARCVTLAKTLGISLVWLVAGEGMMQTGPTAVNEVQHAVDVAGPQRAGRSRLALAPMNNVQSPQASGMDMHRLEKAMRMLRSELDLAGASLSMDEHSDLLGSLYEMLGEHGKSIDADAMLAFNRQLAQRLRQSAQTAA